MGGPRNNALQASGRTQAATNSNNSHQQSVAPALKERSEYGIRLFVRSAALPASLREGRGDCRGGGGLMRRLASCFVGGALGSARRGGGGGGDRMSSSRLSEVWLGFGRKELDSALMRRCVECASAVLLNQDQPLDRPSHRPLDSDYHHHSLLYGPASTSSAGVGGGGGGGGGEAFPTSDGAFLGGDGNSSRGGLLEEGGGGGGGGVVGSSSSSSSSVLLTARAGRSSSNDGRCVVCLEARARVVFFPCRHMKVCRNCSSECTTCPVCRGPIKERHDLFC